MITIIMEFESAGLKKKRKAENELARIAEKDGQRRTVLNIIIIIIIIKHISTG